MNAPPSGARQTTGRPLSLCHFYIAGRPQLSISYALWLICVETSTASGLCTIMSLMSLRTHGHRSPAELRDDVCRAPAASAELVSAALDLVAARCAAPNCADQARRIRALIGTHAWTDAILAVVDLDRSRAIRQLSHDEGEWICRIGSRWAVPDWLDDNVHFTHPVLPLAILGALLSALAQNEKAAVPATSVPSSRQRFGHSISAVSCDNYV
jgi:hypothetical protein